MLTGRVVHGYHPFIPFPRTRSHPCAAHYSRTLHAKTPHSLTITTCHPKMVAQRPRNWDCMSTSSQGHLVRHPFLEAWGQKPELPPSDAQRRTIFALSTPPGKAGIAVIRVSGPDVLGVWQKLVHTPSSDSRKGKARATEPDPWKMHRCRVVHPQSRETLDDGLAVFFKGVGDFTQPKRCSNLRY